MLRKQRVSDLIGSIYCAALDASKWPTALSSLTSTFSWNTACLFQQDSTTGAGTSIGVHNLDLRTFSEYDSYYVPARSLRCSNFLVFLVLSLLLATISCVSDAERSQFEDRVAELEAKPVLTAREASELGSLRQKAGMISETDFDLTKGGMTQIDPPSLQRQSESTSKPEPSILEQFTNPKTKTCRLVLSLNQPAEDGSGSISRWSMSSDSLLVAGKYWQLHRVRLPGVSVHPLPGSKNPPARLVSDDLTPEAVRQAQTLGIDHADRLYEKARMEAIPERQRTPEQKNRLEEVNRMITEHEEADKAFRQAAEQGFADVRLADIAKDAAEARRFQREAQWCRTAKCPERADQWDAAARMLLRGQTPPPLRRTAQEPLQWPAPASADANSTGAAAAEPKVVPPGQSGYVLVGKTPPPPGGQGVEFTIKGHSTLVSTEKLKERMETPLKFEGQVHLEERDTNEPLSFSGYFGFNPLTNSWKKPDLSLAAHWTASDAEPPFVIPIAADGSFEIKQKIDSEPCLTLNVGYGYDHVSTPIDRSQSGQGYNITFNSNPSWITAFTSRIDIDRFQTDYMKAGAINNTQFTWTHWQPPFPDVPMISSGQISDAGYNRLSWEPPYKGVMAYGELSPGTNPDPMPGLDPADWPRAAAYPGPILILPGSWLEGELP